MHLFPANENGSPPFLLESCHIDSTDRQTDLLYDFFIYEVYIHKDKVLVYFYSSCCVTVSQKGNETTIVKKEAEIKQGCGGDLK